MTTFLRLFWGPCIKKEFSPVYSSEGIQTLPTQVFAGLASQIALAPKSTFHSIKACWLEATWQLFIGDLLYRCKLVSFARGGIEKEQIVARAHHAGLEDAPVSRGDFTKASLERMRTRQTPQKTVDGNKGWGRLNQ